MCSDTVPSLLTMTPQFSEDSYSQSCPLREEGRTGWRAEGGTGAGQEGEKEGWKEESKKREEEKEKKGGKETGEMEE